MWVQVPLCALFLLSTLRFIIIRIATQYLIPICLLSPLLLLGSMLCFVIVLMQLTTAMQYIPIVHACSNITSLINNYRSSSVLYADDSPFEHVELPVLFKYRRYSIVVLSFLRSKTRPCVDQS